MSGSQGVQIGDHNTQLNLGLDASVVPPAQRIPDHGGAPVHNLPPASGVFVGRDLAHLGGLLPEGPGGVVVGQAAVFGLGGIGKTELVLHYAHAAAGRYRLVWWITADTPDNIGLGLAALTRRLHPVATLADAQAWAVGWLQHNRNWLLVLDNVEDVEDITELLGHVTGRGHVVVTTRRDLGRAQWKRLRLAPLPLGVLERSASVSLLTDLTGLTDTASAGLLAADLGDLPLALEQAAAYISQHHGLDFAGYRHLLADQFARVVGDGGPATSADRTVASVWRVTMATIRHRSPLAERVIRVLAWLGPDNLPDDVLTLLATTPADTGEALALLASYSMINRTARTVSVHRLVQAATRATAQPDDLAEALRLLTKALPADPEHGVTGWPRWHALLPHIDTALAHLPATHDNAHALHIGDRAAVYRQSQGQTTAATAGLEAVFANSRRVLGDDHPNTVGTHSNLAGSYLEARRYDEAIAAYEAVLAKHRRALGEDHISTLTIRSNLAVAHWRAGRVEVAIAGFESVLADSRRVLGNDDPSTLTTRNTLAGAYRDAGRVDTAISVFEQVLADRRRVLGEDHISTLTTRNNLAHAYRRADRVDAAIAAFQGMLDDCQRILGNDHPYTLSARSSLALSYLTAGRVEAAIPDLEAVLADRRRVLGDDHPETLSNRTSLADAYRDAGRVDEAIVAYAQELADRRRVLGDDHVSTLTTRNNLACAYLDAGREDVAIALLRGVLDDRRRMFGSDHHADTLTTRFNLASAYLRANRLDAAIAAYRELLPDIRRALGDDHRLTKATEHDLDAARRLRPN
ncbi:tetratricopeptide repeat protein [Dactylosporangium sp. CS-047395]|uniref:tetratricopeptide repeat protein n=1 Tax=Dactylosporangium sp. CS-047395 TaxID=3239936 RepID=UPI003D93BDBF